MRTFSALQNCCFTISGAIVNSNGQVIGRDGEPIDGSIKDNATQAHIPLSEWGKWDSPL